MKAQQAIDKLNEVLDGMSSTTAQVVSLEFEGVALPLLVVNGAEPGKVVWFEAALHGDERDGTVALLKLKEELSLTLKQGVVILCPVTNPTAFVAGTNASPLDSKNLNRMGIEEQETFSARYFKWLSEVISNVAQVMVDFHGGGYYLDVLSFALLPSSTEEEFERSQALTKNLDLDCVAKAPWRGELINELSRRGLTTLLLENGGGTAVQSESVERHLSNAKQILRNLGLLDEATQATSAEQVATPLLIAHEYDYYFASDGILTYKAPVGTHLTKGEVIYKVSSASTLEEEVFRCPLEHAIVLSIHNTALVKKGTYAVYLGTED